MHPARIVVLALAFAQLGCGGAPLPEGRAAASATGCAAELHAVLGACVSPKVAAAYCGATGVPSSDRRACVARPPCEPGRARELGGSPGAGECLPGREVRALAAEIGIVTSSDEILACAGDGVLVADSSSRRLGCLEESRGRGRIRIGREGRDRMIGPLTPLFMKPGILDAAPWLRAAVGTDGGSGAPPLCEGLAREPGALLTPESDARVSVSLLFPDNDVSSVTADARYVELPAGMTPAEASAELERVVGPMVEALRSLGGTSLQASVTARVRCRRTSSRPHAEPAQAAQASGAGAGAEPEK